jgi:hypothetical protein
MLIVQVNNLEKLAKLAETAPHLAEKHINKAIQRGLVAILAEQKKTAPVGVNAHLRDRWDISMQRFAGTLRSQVPYGQAVVQGSRPHFVSGNNPQLRAWAEKKGLNPWAVAKSIQKKGTRANPYTTQAIETGKIQVEKEFDTAIQSIISEIARQF